MHISGLVVASYSTEYSHWNALESLSDWLKEFDVPGICGIDTRALTKHLREYGTMLGKIVMHDPEETGFYDPNLENLVALVSTREKMIYPGGETRIMVVDCGVKNNIIRCLLDLGATVIRVPWDYDFSGDDYDGLVVSNGPGDPRQ